MADRDDRAILDKLEGVMDRLEKADPTATEGGTWGGKKTKELSTSADFKALQSIVEENHGLLREDTEILKGDASTNKLANKLQIAKEIHSAFRERTAHTFYGEQKKHNRGARDSRIKIENQNDLIIQDNKKIIELLKERKSGPLLAVGSGGQEDPSASDPDQQRINETVTRIEEKNKDKWLKDRATQIHNEEIAKGNRKSVGISVGKAGGVTDVVGWTDPDMDQANKEWKDKEEKAAIEASKAAVGASKSKTKLEETRKKLYDENVKKAGINPLTGDQQYRDTETGQYTTPGWKTAEIADSIRGASGYAGGTTDRQVSMVSKGAATLSKNIGANAPDIQRGLDDLEKINEGKGKEAKESLEKLTKMMADAASGNRDKSGKRTTADDVRQQAKEARLLMRRDEFGDTGVKLTEDLGLDDVSKDLSSERGVKTAVKNFFGVDSGASVGQGIKQAFTAERLFGIDEEGPSKVASVASGLSRTAKKGLQFGAREIGKTETGQKAKGWIDEKIDAGKAKANVATGKLFGKDLFDPDKKSDFGKTIRGLDTRKIEDRVAEEKAQQALDLEAQTGGLETLMGEGVLDIAQRDEDKEEKVEDTKAAVQATAVTVETTAEKTADIERATERTAVATEELRDMAKDEGSLMVHDVHVEGKLDELLKQKEKKDGRTGQDKESIPERQLETLIDMRDLLEEATAGAALGMDRNSSSGPGFFGRMFGRGGTPRGAPPGTTPARAPGRMSRMFSRAGTAAKGVGPATQAFAQGSGGGLMKGAARGLTRFGGAIAGIGMGVYEGVTGFRDAEARADAGELTAEEEQIEKGEAIGAGTGGASGAIAGAAAGAAIGSVVPIVGTAIGGLIGGAVGYFAGRWAGKKAGGAIADAIPVSASELAESNALAETTLENVGEKDPELVATIRQEADELEAQMMEAAGDEVSDNDKAAIKNAALVKAIQNHTEEIDALPVTGGAQLTSQAEADFREMESSSTTQRIGGTFSEMSLEGQAAEDFEELKQSMRAKYGSSAGTMAAIEWGRMGRTEGFTDLQRTQDGQIVPEGEEMDQIRPLEGGSDMDFDSLEGGMESTTLPTGDAIENITDISSGVDAQMPAPVVVQNQPPAPPQVQSDEPNIAVMPPRVRTADSVIQRYQDKRFRV